MRIKAYWANFFTHFSTNQDEICCGGEAIQVGHPATSSKLDFCCLRNLSCVTQGCQSSAFRRNSAFFFFFTFRFFSNDFPLFSKNRRKKKVSVFDTATLGGFQRASVNSHGRLGLPVFAPSISGQSTKSPISTRHSKFDTRSHAKENRPQNLVTYRASCFEAEGKGGGGGLVAGWRRTWGDAAVPASVL